MKQSKEILDFIKLIKGSHSLMPNIFTEGSCMNFFMILKAFVSSAEAYYNGDHVITRVGRDFYDINGLVDTDELINYLPYDVYFSKCRQQARATAQMLEGEYEID